MQSKNHAADDLAATKAETVRLQAQQAKYADIPRTIAAIDAAETARSTAMANDVEWFRTLNNFSLTLPKQRVVHRRHPGAPERPAPRGRRATATANAVGRRARDAGRSASSRCRALRSTTRTSPPGST